MLVSFFSECPGELTIFLTFQSSPLSKSAEGLSLENQVARNVLGVVVFFAMQSSGGPVVGTSLICTSLHMLPRVPRAGIPFGLPFLGCHLGYFLWWQAQAQAWGTEKHGFFSFIFDLTIYSICMYTHIICKREGVFFHRNWNI